MLQIKLSIAQKGVILVSVPLCSLIFFAVLNFLLDQAEHDRLAEARAKEEITIVSNVGRLMFDAFSALSIVGLAKDYTYKERYQEITSLVPGQFRKAMELAKDDPEQVKRLKHLQLLEERAFAILDGGLKTLESGNESLGFLHIHGLRTQFEAIVKQYRTELAEFVEYERQRASTANSAKWRSTVKKVLLAGVVLNIAASLLMAVLYSKGITRRLYTLMDNAKRFAGGKPLNPVVEGIDEISQLDRVFHEMAKTIKSAIQRERAIVDNAADVICSIDVNNRFTAISPASSVVWGYEPEELLGSRVANLLAQEDAASTLEAMQLRAGQTIRFENRVIRKDGSTVNMLWAASWSQDENRFFCVAHDITERITKEELLKESEARTRLIIESMPVGLLIAGENGAIETSNFPMEKMLGCSYLDLLHRHLMTLFSNPEGLSENAFMELFERRFLGRLGEAQARKHSGELLPVEISVNEFHANDTRKMLVSVIDITERHEVERLKREVISMVSHDLRTPLTSIQTMLSMLKQGVLGAVPDKTKNYIESSEHEVQRLISLVNSLLDIEKLEAGKLHMQFARTEVVSILRKSMEAVGYIAEKNGIAIDMKHTSAAVLGDGSRLVQVLVNLLSNAIKFSAPASTIMVEVQELPPWVQIKVIDQGRGIPESHLDLIFERFQQVESADSQKKGGSGLGLAICKAIIEEHGGKIGVESEVGKGSVFWFRVPMWQESPGSKEI